MHLQAWPCLLKIKTVALPPKKPQKCGGICTLIHSMHRSNHDPEVLLPLNKYTTQMMVKAFLITHLMQTSFIPI